MLRKPNHDRRPMKVETLENRVLPSGFALGAGGLTCTPPLMVAAANPYLTAPALTGPATPALTALAGLHGPRLYTPCLTAGDVAGPATSAVADSAPAATALARPAVSASLTAPVAAPAAAAPVAPPAVAVRAPQGFNADYLTAPAAAALQRPAVDSIVANPAASVSAMTDTAVGKLRDSAVENLKAVDMQIFPAAVNAVMAQVGAQSVNAVVGLACVGPFTTTP